MYTFVDKVYAHKYHENIATTNSYNSTVTEQKVEDFLDVPLDSKFSCRFHKRRFLGRSMGSSSASPWSH